MWLMGAKVRGNCGWGGLCFELVEDAGLSICLSVGSYHLAEAFLIEADASLMEKLFVDFTALVVEAHLIGCNTA